MAASKDFLPRSHDSACSDSGASAWSPDHYACSVSFGARWTVSPPLPKAPPGYDGPPPPDEAVNVLIILDPSKGCAPPDDPMALTNPINRFVDNLARRLGQLANLSTWGTTTDRLRYQEDVPTGISAVVTNDATLRDVVSLLGRQRRPGRA